jgi:FtsZ-binding cell division protein ZapB
VLKIKGLKKMSIQDGVDTPSGNDIEELKSKIAKLETEKTNLVGELQTDRSKRQSLQEQITILQESLADATKVKAAGEPNGGIEDLVTEAVTKALKKTEASKAESNKKSALEKFVREHKEFSSENDVTGKRREALEREFANFNTSSVVEQEDFEALIGKAHKLLGGDTTSETSGNKVITPYASIPVNNGTPRTAQDINLSDREEKLIAQVGWTKERYMKLKAKMPESYISSLLSNVR